MHALNIATVSAYPYHVFGEAEFCTGKKGKALLVRPLGTGSILAPPPTESPVRALHPQGFGLSSDTPSLA